ncbi:MAG: winged helix-turn-helix domain-containing protein [Actinomycetota bacterium]|nr:winged helix-turn-helix domain-containing protein [Actinomycetota bacterium]
MLVERWGQLVRKEELLDQVWGDRFVSESALTTRIKSTRQAVGDDGVSQRVICTVHGKGYEFVAEVRVIDTEPAADGVVHREPQSAVDSALPTLLQPLIGRLELLAQLVEDQAANRLVTLVGASGVGKTVVGLELARTIGDSYRDGVFVIELVTVADEDATVSAFATALDVNTRQETSLEDAIVDMLRPRHALLLLDNCEHLVEPVALLVDRILRSAPRVSIVATSREPLALPGEHVWTVEPLPTGDLDDVPVDELATVPAVALFLERSRAADPRFELNEITAPAVVEICRRLDGIPLAIELAASRTSAIDVTEVARRLDERFRLLKGVRRGADPRHQTLHDAISWSYDLLDEEEQHLFASLSVFAGQFDLGAAESVCNDDDVLDLLTRLARRSMLAVRRPSHGGTRYEMLETLREYGRNRLGDLESGDLHTAHADHFASLAGSVGLDLGTPQEHDAVRRADGSFADLRAAQRFARHIDDADTALGLIASLREYAMRTLRYEVFAWADASAGLTDSDHPLHPIVTAIRGYGAWVRGEFALARDLAESARRVENDHGVAATGLVERVLNNVLYATGEIERGLIEGVHMIELAEDSGDDSRIAHANYMASIGSSSIGDYDEAKRLIGASREAAHRTGSPTDLASGFVAEGFATHADAEAALEAFATADRLARSAGNRWLSAFARTEASGLLVHAGRLADGCQGLAEMVDTW